MNKGNRFRIIVRLAGAAIAVVSLVGLATLPSIHNSYKSRAVMTQRVQVDAAGASLFGDGSTPIGSPQLMIIEDPKAVVGSPDSKDGVRQVSDAYLQQHHIYPLQLKTVDFTLSLIQYGLFAGLLVGVIGFLVGTKRPRI